MFENFKINRARKVRDSQLAKMLEVAGYMPLGKGKWLGKYSSLIEAGRFVEDSVTIAPLEGMSQYYWAPVKSTADYRKMVEFMQGKGPFDIKSILKIDEETLMRIAYEEGVEYNLDMFHPDRYAPSFIFESTLPIDSWHSRTKVVKLSNAFEKVERIINPSKKLTGDDENE